MTATTWRLVPAEPDQAWTDAFAARGPRIGSFAATICAVLDTAPTPGFALVTELQAIRAALAFLPVTDAAVSGLDRIMQAVAPQDTAHVDAPSAERAARDWSPTQPQTLATAIFGEKIGLALDGSAALASAPVADEPDWANRRTDSLAGWINELGTLSQHRSVKDHWLRNAMRTIHDRLSRYAALASAPVAATYVEARECAECNHVGINDSSDTQAACTQCDWSGDSPKDDHCPGCARDGTMTAACPKCGGRYSLLADRMLGNASAPVAGEAQPAAWLYRECRFPSRHGYEYRDVLSATLLDHYYTGRDETYVKGEPLYTAPQAREAVLPSEGGRESVDDALAVVESFGPGIEDLNDNYARQVILADEVRRLRGVYESAVKGRQDFRNALRAERAQKTQDDKDGGDCAKGAGGNLIQEFIDATDALLASQERKTWTSGYKNALSAGERIRIAERWRQLRAALSSPTPPDKDGGVDA